MVRIAAAAFAAVSNELHSMLERAAELQGRTMTDFIAAAVQGAAQRAIEDVIGANRH